MASQIDGVIPDPVLPDYDGASLVNVVPSLLSLVGRGHPEGDRPAWLPAPVTEARQIVLLVLDGLGWEQLQQRRALAPTLAAAVGGPITSVAPSTTAAALTSLTTGLPPAAHGVLGYRVQLHGGIFNVLKWRLDGVDARQRVPSSSFQPHPPFPGAPGTPVVSKVEFASTGFTAAHLGGAVLHGWHTSSGMKVEIARVVASGAPFVYAYYDGIDRVSHSSGLGEHYDAELTSVDRMVADLLETLPPEAVLVVTADHGQVHVGRTIEVVGGDLMDAVTLMSGEGRFRWLHTRAGAAEDVAQAARAAYGHVAWVYTRDEVIEHGLLGGEPLPAVADRLGDVALVPFDDTAFLDPADTGEQRLVGRHGSLTSAEMYVPLLAWPAL